MPAGTREFAFEFHQYPDSWVTLCSMGDPNGIMTSILAWSSLEVP